MPLDPKADAQLLVALVASLSSLTCDFFAYHKVGGTHLIFFFCQQLVVLPPSVHGQSVVDFLIPCLLKLIYTSHAMATFARNLGCEGPPVGWDEDHCINLCAEFDAFYARAYSLPRDEFRYVLGPVSAKGASYHSETFRILKTNKIRKYGEYHTERLVLSALDRLERGN